MYKNIKLHVLRFHAQQDPVFVLQMGRVGSMSITAAIKNAYKTLSLSVPVYHGHYLANYDLLIERINTDMKNPASVLNFDSDKELRGVLLNYFKDRQPIKVVSIVRDPIARNVSTFFYVFSSFAPDWKEIDAKQKFLAQELMVLFENKQSFIQTAFNWFDEQLNEVLDIDVYAVPFDSNRGWQIYKKGLAELLVLRMEDLYRTGEDALRNFLQIPNLHMVHVNTGEERDTYELYQRFLAIPISEEYLKKAYETKLAKHFYTPKEIDEFMRHWLHRDVDK